MAHRTMSTFAQAFGPRPAPEPDKARFCVELTKIKIIILANDIEDARRQASAALLNPESVRFAKSGERCGSRTFTLWQYLKACTPDAQGSR